MAKIQSSGASNRIENISTSDVRLRELTSKKSEPKNRDEREIAGCRYVLDLIHGQHDDIPVTPGVILQLHRDLYRFEDAAFAGRWKDSDNVIAELRIYFAHLVGAATKSQIMDANPCMSKRTMERILKKLMDEGSVEKVGAARFTAYRALRR